MSLLKRCISTLQFHILKLHSSELQEIAQDEGFEFQDSAGDEKTIYICCLCFRPFYLKQQLRRHIAECGVSHFPVAPVEGTKKENTLAQPEWHLQCPICLRKFPQKGALTRHLLYKSCTTVCQICGYRPRKPCELGRHMVKHTRERIPCPYCDKKFSRKYMLTRHLVEHEFSIYKCSNCNKQCTGKAEMLEHYDKFHKRFCERCGKQYSRARYLQTHMSKCRGAEK